MSKIHPWTLYNLRSVPTWCDLFYQYVLIVTIDYRIQALGCGDRESLKAMVRSSWWSFVGLYL